MQQHETHLHSDGQVMTDKQIRDVVTPYEFGVSDSIVGTPLARPLRRGVALLIDLILVVMLTDLPSILLAALGVVFFWRAGKRKNTPSRFVWFRKTLKGISALLLFGILVAVFNSINAPPSSRFTSSGDNEAILTGAQGIAVAGLMIGLSAQLEQVQQDIESGQCEPQACWERVTTQLTGKITQSDLPPSVVHEVADRLESRMRETLTPSQTEALLATLTAEVPVVNTEQAVQEDDVSDRPLTTPGTEQAIPTNDNGDPSLLAWARGLLEDLGIGFGWAALYFTALTYWMKGQTPGKFVMKLKVIKLDGSTMTLWESFERYGGYGAGLATGLLGFAQIFWEPNRQAIHDKISETLVIHLGREKVPVQAIHEYRMQCAEGKEGQTPAND